MTPSGDGLLIDVGTATGDRRLRGTAAHWCLGRPNIAQTTLPILVLRTPQ